MFGCLPLSSFSQLDDLFIFLVHGAQTVLCEFLRKHALWELLFICQVLRNGLFTVVELNLVI
jgi:hypothetical protein